VEGENLVPVSIPLPPATGKCRVALTVPPNAVLLRESPRLLRVAASAAAPAFRSTIDSLVALGARTGIEPSVIGSLLWEHLTGFPYLTPHSDLDVLWAVPTDFDVRSLVFDIAEVQRRAPVRIDGEIILPDGSGVNWRELWEAYRAANTPTVLAKRMENVRLLDVSSLPGVARRA
jgi:phosphoribosyl-dephospho-CoA transferase